MVNEKKGECPYFHRNCPSGCNKVDCRSHFPKEVKVIMDSQKPVCTSPEHLECPRFHAGNTFREEQKLSKKGCIFLADNFCGRKGIRYCKGHVPPFEIKDDNLQFLENCYKDGFEACPNYKTGMAFQEEVKRVKGLKASEA